MQGLSQLLLALISSVLLGLTAVLVMYRMLDGEIELLIGLPSIVLILFLLAMCVKPTSSLVPGVVLFLVTTMILVFPFAENQLATAELRKMNTEKMINAYNAYSARPDNVAALLEVARQLHSHGLPGPAIALATKVLNSLSNNPDPVSNRSIREYFRTEEYMVRNWSREAANDPKAFRQYNCPSCRHLNPAEAFLCEGCGRPYLIDIARETTVRPRTFGKLVLTFAAVAFLIVASCEASVEFDGTAKVAAIACSVLISGGIIGYLFRPTGPV